MSLSRGEAFWIWRRRRRLTQAAMAAEYRVDDHVVYAWEHDTKEAPLIDVGPLSVGEQCALLRRRSGRTLTEVARGVGCSRPTLLNRERDRGRVGELVRYWGAKALSSL